MKNIFRFDDVYNDRRAVGFSFWIFGRRVLIWWDKVGLLKNEIFHIHRNHDAVYLWRLVIDWNNVYSL